MTASVLTQLASAVGERTQEPNERAAKRCLARPELLEEIAAGLEGKDARLAGDCAEVMTKVAQERPELVAPFVERLVPRLWHKNGRVRWETAHAIGLTAARVPETIEKELPRLTRLIREDESVIVRDYLVDAVAAWGATSSKAARAAFPILHDAAGAFAGKHAARILGALAPIARAAPVLAGESRSLAQGFAEHSRPGVRKAAKALLKALAAV